MSSLKERFATARKRAPAVTNAQIATACHISAAAVSKWFSGASKKIKTEHVFIVARLYNVDPEWLALGRGKPDRKSGTASNEFEDKHIDLLRMYKRLPGDIRDPIRAVIQTLAAAHSERYASWSRQMAELAEEDQ